MPVVDCIRSNHTNAIIRRCSEKGCSLKLDGLGNRIVLKGEIIYEDRKICDCIIFAGDNCIIIGIVELKSKTIHSSEIREKLENGSEIALDILEKCSSNRVKFEFYHVVLSKGWRSAEHKIISRRNKIKVRGKRYDIIPKRCGVSFSMIISSFQ